MTSDAQREIEALRRLLHEHDVVDQRHPESAPITAADSTRLARSITAAHPAPQARTRAPRRALTTLGAIAACVALAIAVVVGVVRAPVSEAATTPRMLDYSLSDPRTPLSDAPAATDALATVAQAARHSNDLAGTGDVQYVASYGWYLSIEHDTTGTTSQIFPTFTRSWLTADGSATVTQSRGSALDADGRASPDAPTGIGGTDVLPVGALDAGLAARLAATTDEAALQTALLELSTGLSCDQDARWHAQCLVEAVLQVHNQYVVPPTLAARLWDLLGHERAIRDLGTTTDRLGRPAVAVALPSDPDDTIRSTVNVLLISPDTGQLTGTETITLSDTVSPVTEPTVTSFTAWTDRQPVSAVGQVP